eukprot:5705069-Amphidinium_carterae.2
MFTNAVACAFYDLVSLAFMLTCVNYPGGHCFGSELRRGTAAQGNGLSATSLAARHGAVEGISALVRTVGAVICASNVTLFLPTLTPLKSLFAEELSARTSRHVLVAWRFIVRPFISLGYANSRLFGSPQDKVTPANQDAVRGLVPALEKLRAYRGRGGEVQCCRDLKAHHPAAKLGAA